MTEAEWQDERRTFHMTGSLTELYAQTANTIDRIDQEIHGGLAAKPLRAALFVTLDTDGNIGLFQSGGAQELIWLATQAAEHAMRVLRDGYDEGLEK